MDRRLVAPLVAEALGTFLFVFIGVGSIVLYGAIDEVADLVGIALAHGITLAVVVTAFGAVSGGHVNPAVTVGLWIAGAIDATRAAGYVAAQLVGAAAAGFLIAALYPRAAWEPVGLGAPSLAGGLDPLAGLALEVVMTMLLVTAVFMTAVDPRAPKLGGLLIGLSIVGCILVAGPLTGAAMNPARWFGPALAAGNLANAWVWIAGPLAGAGIVALLYRFVLREGALTVR